jgi:hypothetical protein
MFDDADLPLCAEEADLAGLVEARDWPGKPPPVAAWRDGEAVHRRLRADPT